MKAFLYSGSCLSRSISSAAEFFTGSMTMRQGLPFLRAMQHTATAEPTASRSANLCPMAKTREESAISSARALAITRLLTLVRVSTSLPRPPKNSKLKRFFTTAWSPPRERAISTARELNWKSSPKPLPSTPRPMLTEAWMPLGLTTSCTRSSSGNLSALIWSRWRDSKMKR